MKTETIYVLRRVSKNYYGPGDDMTSYLLGRHRYTSEPKNTCNIGSASLYMISDAVAEAAKLAEEGFPGYSPEIFPDEVKLDLRSCFA